MCRHFGLSSFTPCLVGCHTSVFNPLPLGEARHWKPDYDKQALTRLSGKLANQRSLKCTKQIQALLSHSVTFSGALQYFSLHFLPIFFPNKCLFPLSLTKTPNGHWIPVETVKTNVLHTGGKPAGALFDDGGAIFTFVNRVCFWVLFTICGRQKASRNKTFSHC